MRSKAYTGNATNLMTSTVEASSTPSLRVSITVSRLILLS